MKLKKKITIVFSNHCNMDMYGGCAYCCIQNRNTSGILSLEKIFELVDPYYSEGLIEDIEFFGGEPLLHLNLIKLVLERYKNVSYRLYTNGLFDCTEEILEPLSRFKEVLVSLDGTLDLNTARGITNLEFSYKRALDFSLFLLNNLIPVSIASVPFTKRHLDLLPSTYDYFYSLGFRSFSLEIPTIIKDKNINKNFSDKEVLSVLDFFYLKYLPDLFSEKVYLFNIPKELANEQLNVFPCSETNIAIAPSGNIYHCRDTAANEKTLIKESKISFYSNLENIKKAEQSSTCHVKNFQGFSSSDLKEKLGSFNYGRLLLMYSIIKYLNYYYAISNGDIGIFLQSVKNLKSSIYE